MIEKKNTQSKKYVLGQYWTAPDVCADIVNNINFENSIVIEPSFGTGNFLHALKHINNQKIGIELDNEIFSYQYADANTKLLNQDFYDFDIKTNKKLIFIGNPPYRTPAYSLGTHKDFLMRLTKKYNVPGIREEAVFFILHTIDIIRNNGGYGEIHYILPEALLKNNSKFFTRFKQFLKEQCIFVNIRTIKNTAFDAVSQDLVYLFLDVKPVIHQDRSLFFYPDLEPQNDNVQKYVLFNGNKVLLDDYLCLGNDDIIPFQKIFKRTYLGSVPCESLLMSVEGESREHFQSRLISIINDKNIDTESLYDKLQFKGKFHLKIFSGALKSDAMVQKKLQIILSYVKNLQTYLSIQDFWNSDYYKEINVRNGIRYYFRCDKIKKHKNFVYELNPNPCRSFYFTGNPSHSSTDYFGFCNYDINRNVSPGANRTVPVDNVEDNLTDSFKAWWRANTDEPFYNIFEYIMYVAKTDWYKQMKRQNKRFYFAIPAEFIPKEVRNLKKVV